MKRSFLVALGLCFLQLQASAGTAQRLPAKAKGAWQRAAVMALPADILDIPELPAVHRKGVDQGAVLRAFEVLGHVTKSEFETSEAYAQRLNAAWEKSPITPSRGLLGFVVDTELAGIRIGYDADAQRYMFQETGSIADFCRLPPSRVRRSTNVELCVVGILNHKASTYDGQNAFGVSAEVDRERGTYLSLAISRKSPLITDYQNHIYRFTDMVDFPLERARGYRTADLRMMLVGEISGPDLVEGEGTIMQPRLDSPYDVMIDNKGLPFALHAVVYFFRTDGRIVAVRDFCNKL